MIILKVLGVIVVAVLALIVIPTTVYLLMP